MTPRSGGWTGSGSVITGILRGAGAGLAGPSVTIAAEKVEQALTGRPSSFVPGRTLAHLLRLPEPDCDSLARNWAMHYGTGMVAGILRAGMSASNLRGPGPSARHAQLRLSIDQTLENLTGVGAPPWTWPRDELIIDVCTRRCTRLRPAPRPTRWCDRCPAAPSSGRCSRGDSAASPDDGQARGAKRPPGAVYVRLREARERSSSIF